MRLTSFFDYTLRLLMYAATHGDRLVTIEETASVYGISRTHLMKVANQLTRAGYLKAVRGRSGGLMLAKRPNRIKRRRFMRHRTGFRACGMLFLKQPLSHYVELPVTSTVEGSADSVHHDARSLYARRSHSQPKRFRGPTGCLSGARSIIALGYR